MNCDRGPEWDGPQGTVDCVPPKLHGSFDSEPSATDTALAGIQLFSTVIPGIAQTLVLVIAEKSRRGVGHHRLQLLLVVSILSDLFDHDQLVLFINGNL